MRVFGIQYTICCGVASRMCVAVVLRKVGDNRVPLAIKCIVYGCMETTGRIPVSEEKGSKCAKVYFNEVYAWDEQDIDSGVPGSGDCYTGATGEALVTLRLYLPSLWVQVSIDTFGGLCRGVATFLQDAF